MVEASFNCARLQSSCPYTHYAGVNRGALRQRTSPPVCLVPQRHVRRRSISVTCGGLTPNTSTQLPRIIDSIPRKGPAPGFPHFPEINLREPIDWAQREASSDRYSWPMLMLAAVALAVVAEASMILKDRVTGQTRQSRSERREVRDAARRAEDAQLSRAQADQLARLPEAEQRLLETEQAYKRQLLQTDRLEERNRGLLWLAVITLGMLWIAGAFEIDATHPFLF